MDIETGEVRLLRYAACHDVGRAINPMRVEGQIQGGAAQGIGYALSEDCVDRGRPSAVVAVRRLPDPDVAWTCPTSASIVVESGEGKGPLGARGIGEPPIGPPAATIASAIEAAIGIRPTELPMTPERVLALLDKRSQQSTEKGRHQ